MENFLLKDLGALVARPHAVLFIVGSGVSIGATQGTHGAAVASWDGLLRDGVRRVRTLHGFGTHLGPPNPVRCP
ncbi:MAG: hypothetical protein ACKOET_11680, partial [Verrucomicrobiota bacterium]